MARQTTQGQGYRGLEIEAGHSLVSVWRTVSAAGLGTRWIADVTDLRTGHTVGAYSHHATRERAVRAANRMASTARRVAGAL
jgi:hypothetical protein